jgi:hypothetical protein
VLACLVLVACGRIGFSPVVQGDGGGVGGGDGASDGPGSVGDGATAGWNLVQVRGGTTGTVGVTATTGGDLLIVAAQLNSADTVVSIADNAPGGSATYTQVPGARASDTLTSVRDAVEVWYGVAQPGATTITVSAANTPPAIVVWEVAGLASAPPFIDVAGQISQMAQNTSAFSPALTTTADGDFVVAIAIVQNQVTGLFGGNGRYFEDLGTNNQGWAHLTDPHTPAGPEQTVWATTSGTWCTSAAAFFAAR